MSEIKFTPGPWVYNQGRIESEHEHGWVNDGWCLAECHGPQEETNGHLIAAAPELYEALEAIIARWDTPLWKDVEPTAVFINKGRDVLSKARGEA